MRLHVPIPLRWGDLDAYGHINNVETLRLIEEARVRSFWRGQPDDPDPQPTAVLDLSADSGVWSLVSRTEIEYLVPMPYSREPIDIEVWLGRIGGANIEICFELYSPVGVVPRVLFARATASIVTVDAASARPTRIPAELRELAAPYIEEPISFTRR
jgi:acyl-CoA thioester hydrolase